MKKAGLLLLLFVLLCHCGGTQPTTSTSVSALDPAAVWLSSYDDNKLGRMSRSGSIIDSFVTVPYSGRSSLPNERVRDPVVDYWMRPNVYDGTAAVKNHYLAGPGQFYELSIANHTTVSNVTYGGSAALGEYVYMTDMGTSASDTNRGIIRFDMSRSTSARYATGYNFIDVTVGKDRNLYALTTGYWSNGGFQGAGGIVIKQYDPLTMSELSSITIATEVRAIAVNGSGEIFGAAYGGTAYKFTSSGSSNGSLAVGIGNLRDIDISDDGTVMAVGRSGTVAFFDQSLGSLTTVSIPGYGSSFNGFAAAFDERAPSACSPTCSAGDICTSSHTCSTLTCDHSTCETGVALSDGCSSCVTTVCNNDDYCCAGDGEWDHVCVQEATWYCSAGCGL